MYVIIRLEQEQNLSLYYQLVYGYPLWALVQGLYIEPLARDLHKRSRRPGPPPRVRQKCACVRGRDGKYRILWVCVDGWVTRVGVNVGWCVFPPASSALCP